MTERKRRSGVNSKHWLYERPSGVGFSRDRDGGSLVDLPSAHLYGGNAPVNEYQALMEADAFEEPRMDVATLEGSGRKVEELLASKLTPDEALVVSCIVYGNMTLEETADVHAREHGLAVPRNRKVISRLRDSAFRKLREVYDGALPDSGERDKP